MAWMYILIAGILEMVWAVGLKYSDSFTRIIPSIITGVAAFLSVFFLGLSMRQIPLGTAYAVWTGIGTLGTVLYGVMFFGETVTLLKIISFLFIVVGVIGLKWCV